MYKMNAFSVNACCRRWTSIMSVLNSMRQCVGIFAVHVDELLPLINFHPPRRLAERFQNQWRRVVNRPVIQVACQYTLWILNVTGWAPHDLAQQFRRLFTQSTVFHVVLHSFFVFFNCFFWSQLTPVFALTWWLWSLFFIFFVCICRQSEKS